MKELEKILKAVANRRRLSILKCIKQRNEATVGEIAGNIKLSFRSTSRHINILRSFDIIENRQDGLRVFYKISREQNPVIKNIISFL